MIAAEDERILVVLHDASIPLNIGQVTDVEALRRAFELELIERNYNTHIVFQMFNLPMLRLTDKAFDWAEERGLSI